MATAASGFAGSFFNLRRGLSSLGNLERADATQSDITDLACLGFKNLARGLLRFSQMENKLWKRWSSLICKGWLRKGRARAKWG